MSAEKTVTERILAFLRRKLSAVPAVPLDPECFGGPLDGQRLPPLGALGSWQCVEYVDSRRFKAVSGPTCTILHSLGAVYWRGVYVRQGDRYVYRPMRSRFCNSLQPSPLRTVEDDPDA